MTTDPRYRTARWQKTRAAVIRRDGRRCAVPGCKADMRLRGMTHVDHVVEISDGGSFFDVRNCQVLCKPHHDSKSAAVRARRRNEPVSPNA